MRVRKEVDYSNYKFTPGYTGFAAKHLKDPSYETVKVKRSFLSNIPGYSGFVPSLKSENVFGITQGRASSLSRQGKIECKRGQNINHWDNHSSKDKFQSTIQASFNDKFKQMYEARWKGQTLNLEEKRSNFTKSRNSVYMTYTQVQSKFDKTKPRK